MRERPVPRDQGISEDFSTAHAALRRAQSHFCCSSRAPVRVIVNQGSEMSGMKEFSELTEQELLALAVALEEEDSRTYSDLAEAMRETYPGTARMFAAMAAEEDGHRHRLLSLYREKFGDHIPLIRRQDVKGFLERKSLWLLRPLASRRCATRRS
jgi:hypothetical protein